MNNQAVFEIPGYLEQILAQAEAKSSNLVIG
jgi:hypothetical protein